MKFYQKWQGRNCSPERNAWFEATVPGNIQKDYAIANNFADWQYSDNHKQFIELEDDHWEYRTSLCYDKKDGERVFFVSEGINYKYDVLLNGDNIYSYEGMFRGFELDITDKLTGKDDMLTVHIYPHPKSTRGEAGTRDEANESCNPPVYYGWDWNPRLLISGMWDEAYIETRDETYIDKCEVLAELSDDMTEGFVSCVFQCALPCEIMLFDADGAEIYRGTDKSFRVKAPKLWWCNGQGEAYLYKWVIRNAKEERTGYIGFRRLRLLRNLEFEGPKVFPKGPYEAPITIELNGRRIFCKGSNWVNPELFWGDITAELYEKQILLAKNCNMNIFRMWGGAGAPKKSFYDICDREGMLVWQEFMLACNEYIGLEGYMKTLESEASAIIRKFRYHACLVFWCGGNELFNSWSGMDQQSHPLRLLDKLCYELDYKRPFLFTSPLIGMAHGGYTFYSDDQGGDVFQQFQSSNCTAYTEFGVPAIASMDTLKTIIPENEMFPPEPTPAWIAHHGFGAWGMERWLCKNVLDKYFDEPSSMREMVDRSNWLQCEGYRGAFEEIRRQWPRCSMGINWCYNEPWKTAAGNNLLAYPSTPRPSYYYVQKAMRPTLFSARVPKFDWKRGETFEAELWLLNDAPESVKGSVKVSAEIGGAHFDLGEWRTEVQGNTNGRGPTVRFVLPDIDGTDKLILKLDSEDGRESCYEYLYRPKKNIKKIRQLNV